ncbi:hypothetical protein BJ085DRAFT_29090 [Dimargaris cristalligena]|uniref:TEX10-like TPR repeats domain-containing protein n=1 Tax=Dimargaris cristalligena TaxID=215637 RepID=A0A4P9ZUR8_9FUNG|nr:hypothetical protein BJ085DRAFT_29090 [Dimargaris cristalligena]|eukprot:RKP36552.1 hypothetical protein BJ085DRAFT_29090 [Dimargaris cristalligena]
MAQLLPIYLDMLRIETPAGETPAGASQRGPAGAINSADQRVGGAPLGHPGAIWSQSHSLSNPFAALGLFGEDLAQSLQSTPSAQSRKEAHSSSAPALIDSHTILRVLWRSDSRIHEFTNNPQSELCQLLKHMMVYFPFGRDLVKTPNPKTSSIYQDMNSAVCELIALFIAAQSPANAPPAPSQVSGKLSKLRKDVQLWAQFNLDYILTQLGAGPLGPPRSTTPQKRRASAYPDDSSENRPASPLFEPKNFLAVLPAIWRLQKSLGPAESKALWEGLLTYYHAHNARSPAKHVALGYLARLFEIQTYTAASPTSALASGSSLGEFNVLPLASLEKWLLSLPKLLWELKTGHSTSSSTIVRVLTLALKRYTPHLSPGFSSQLQLTLVPFFYIEMPNRGAMFGPFVSLSGELQRAVVDLLHYCPDLEPRTLAALNVCLKEKSTVILADVYSYIHDSLGLPLAVEKPTSA